MVGQQVLASRECQRLAFDLTHIWNKRLKNPKSKQSFDLKKWALIILTVYIISCAAILPRLVIGMFSKGENDRTIQNVTEEMSEIQELERYTNITDDEWKLPNLSFDFIDVAARIPGIVAFFVFVVLLADVCAVVGIYIKRSILLIPFIVASSTVLWIVFFLFMFGDAWSETDKIRIKTIPNLLITAATTWIIWSYYNHLKRAEATEKIKDILRRSNHEVQTRVSKDHYTDVPVYNYPNNPQNVVLVNKMYPNA